MAPQSAVCEHTQKHSQIICTIYDHRSVPLKIMGRAKEFYSLSTDTVNEAEASVTNPETDSWLEQSLNAVTLANSLWGENTRRTDEIEDQVLDSLLKSSRRDYDPDKDWFKIKRPQTKSER